MILFNKRISMEWNWIIYWVSWQYSTRNLCESKWYWNSSEHLSQLLYLGVIMWLSGWLLSHDKMTWMWMMSPQDIDCIFNIIFPGLTDQGLYRVVGVNSKVNKLTNMGLGEWLILIFKSHFVGLYEYLYHILCIYSFA